MAKRALNTELPRGRGEGVQGREGGCLGLGRTRRGQAGWEDGGSIGGVGGVGGEGGSVVRKTGLCLMCDRHVRSESESKEVERRAGEDAERLTARRSSR